MNAIDSELGYLLDALPAHIALLDEQGTILSVNQAWRRFASANVLMTEGFCVGQNYFAICEAAHGDCADDAQKAAAGIRAVLDGKTNMFVLEYPCHSPTEERWFRMNATRAENSFGERAVVMHSDVTDLRKAQEAERAANLKVLQTLEKTQQLQARFIEQAPASIALFDQDMRYVAFSAQWKKIRRVPDDAIGKSLFDLAPYVANERRESYQRAFAGEIVRSEKDTFQWPDGSVQYLRWEMRPWRNDAGGIDGLVVYSEDITERVKADAERRASEALVLELIHRRERDLRSFIEQAPAAIAMFDQDMRYIAVSGRWRDDYNLDADVLGRSHYEVLPEIPERWKEIHRRALAGEVLRAEEDPFARLGSSTQWLTWEVRPWYRDGKEIGGVTIFSEDVTARKLTQSELRDSEDRLRAIVDTALEAIIVINERGEIQSMNPAGEKLFGYRFAEAVGRNVKMLMGGHFRQEHDFYMSNYLRTGEKKIIGLGRVVAGQRKDGSNFPVELAVGEARVTGGRLFVGFVRDLTEVESESRRAAALQSELLHVSRLSEMGHVAASIAHEVNQPLAATINYARTAQQILMKFDSPALAELIEKIEKQANRASDIVDGLRSFVEKRAIERRPEDLRRVIEESLALAFLGSGRTAPRVAMALGETPLPVFVEKVQIQQVLVNYIRNATDATAKRSGRTITIKTSIVEPARVRVDVSDNGPGVASDVAGQLFTPFVTTKDDGMGIGLSVCKMIVESHGGQIGFEPNNPQGTTFFFTLPLSASRGPDTVQS